MCLDDVYVRLCIHGSASSSRSIHASCNTHLLCNCTLEYCRRHIAILFHWLPCIIHDPFIHPFISSHSFLYFIFACCIYNPFQCRRRVVIVCVCVLCMCFDTSLHWLPFPNNSFVCHIRHISINHQDELVGFVFRLDILCASSCVSLRKQTLTDLGRFFTNCWVRIYFWWNEMPI